MAKRAEPKAASETFAGLDQIICGDVLEVLARIPRESVHLIITSPPYNLDKDYEEHSDDTADGVSGMLSAPA